VHLLAEVIENATIFSAKDTPVHVAAQGLTSGGVLVEVSDSGVGVPEARLAELNWRLDNPPVMDVSASRHMGLFAVARLAERRGVRVRLRPRSPHGLTALVWLPDSVTEREAGLYSARSRTFVGQGRAVPGRGTPGHGLHARPATDVQLADYRRDVIVPDHAATGPLEPDGSGGWAAGNGRESDGSGGSAAGKHAAQIVSEPVRGGLTAAGLPTRVPQANLIPGAAGGGGPGRPASGPAPQTPVTARSPRSADAARSRLSGFQRGGRRAKSLPRDSQEGAER